MKLPEGNKNCKLYGSYLIVRGKYVKISFDCDKGCPLRIEPKMRIWLKGINCVYQKSPKLGTFRSYG